MGARRFLTGVFFVTVTLAGCAAGDTTNKGGSNAEGVSSTSTGSSAGGGMSVSTGTGGTASSSAGGGGNGGSGGVGASGGGGAGGGPCVPKEEKCNGTDDNCDGTIDEGCTCKEGDTVPCYTGDPSTKGIGACTAGLSTCDLDGIYGPCMGDVTPQPETCNNIDDDCDGTVDEDLGDITCGLGACTVSVGACVLGQPQPCNPLPPGQETCDGTDDDCDGTIDNGCSCLDGSTQSCYSGGIGTQGVGACKDGTQTCDSGQWGACVGEVLPSPETCNGVDDNCDGEVDEDLGTTPCGVGGCQVVAPNCLNGQPNACVPGDPQPETCNGVDDDCNGTDDDGLGTISCGVGECFTTVDACKNGQPNVCAPKPPGSEICNGKDDDCDGSTDEGDPGGGAACNSGQPGVCAAGTEHCVSGAIACVANAQPTPEQCNGKDDDCNGSVDNGNPGGGVACNSGQLGECAAGTTACENGAVVCNANLTPVPEQCNSKDDDCDGTIDDGNPGGNVACNTGKSGVCAAGLTSCQGGTLACVQQTQASPELCNGKDDDCDGFVDDGNPESGKACDTGNPGICAPGTTSCNNGTLICNQNAQPTTETCNGKDDDCDGSTDDGNPGGGLSCNTGKLGACAAGTTACTSGAIVCNQNVQPKAETCNGIDDDCNGATDEGNPGGGLSCSTGKPGICSAGTTACTNGSVVCNQNVQSKSETCNGLDDDCDGQVDDGNPGGNQVCSTGKQGVCAAGTTSCTGGAVVCNQNVQPSAETCDGKDDDCNGQVDEGNPGGGVACNTGKLGVCAAGTTACQNGTVVCVQNVQSAAETCDGLDNDCDGIVDDGNPGGNQACNTGKLGVCAPGTTQCSGGAVACVQNVQPSAEICDGLDNDCNGAVDNGNPGGNQACNTGLLGVCAAGTTACQSGAVVCNQNVQPSAEVCDGLDNDCNGAVDNGNPGGGQSCNTGKQGVCSAGTTACQAGSVVCNQNVQPSAEVCDGLDNDCNGAVDNGNPGGGQSCSTGKQGECAAGTTACTAGSLVCNQNVQPSAEVCDGKDNDCNGTVDNGNPGGGQSCNTGKQGECAPGTTACQGGAVVCNQNVQSTSEICDGKDNDCDGIVDDGNPGGNQACSTGKLGVCAAGTTACSSGAIACIQNVQPSAETCDGLDNDCNGAVDNGNPGGGLSCSTGKQGVCAAGTTACTSGAIACNQNVQPSAETCDGLDNDCNGAVDNGNPGGGLSCSTGKPGVCGPGTTACSSGAIVCNQNVQPSAEICDGLDNDCNAVVDNGNPGGGQSCSTGKPGVCGPGTTACTGGALKCNQNVAPSQEICDSLDNDCDGRTDLDAYVNSDTTPNTCATAGNKTVHVAPGGQIDVSGTVDPKGDDFFTVIFDSVPGVGNYYHPKIDLINSAGGQYVFVVRKTCASATECAKDLTTLEMLWPNNPNNCKAFGNCSDATPRTTTSIVEVKRTASPTTCSSWTVRASNL